MRVGYVVLYVNDAEACRRFWVEQVGMVEKRRTEAVVEYNLGSTAQIILIIFAVGFGAVAQLILGRRATRWVWLTGATAGCSVPCS